MNNITDLEMVIMMGLNDTLESRNSQNVEIFIYLIFLFDVYYGKYVPILNDLLNCEWHYQHENIIMILQKLKSPTSVESIYKEIFIDREYLKYNDNESKIVKCLWALSKIGTDDAIKIIEILAKNENQMIQHHAIEQLERIRKKDEG